MKNWPLSKKIVFWFVALLVSWAFIMSFVGCRSVCVCDGVSSAWCPACRHLSVDCPRFRHCEECAPCLRMSRLSLEAH